VKTLITGSTGFIGRRLTNRLSSLGRELRCAVRPLSETTALLNRPCIELTCADLFDKGSVRNLVRGTDVVYHLAFDYSRPAVDDVRNLLEACLSGGVRRFVYFSSIGAVGLSDIRHVITESTPCRPDTVYGRVKRAAEEILLEAHAKQGFPVVIVRPTSVYGMGEANFWLPLFQAIHGGRLSRLFGDGSNLLSLCFVDNLIDGAQLAEQCDVAPGQIYILSDERPYTFREVVDAIAAACEVSAPRSTIQKRLALPLAHALDYLWRLELTEPVVPFLAGNVARWIAHYPCSVAKAHEELGFDPAIGLSEGVRRTVNWYRENGFLCRSVPWTEGVLDMESLPEPSNSWQARAARAGGRAVRLAWNVAALGWRLPPKVARRVRRLMEQRA
jgi:nucleoside-diphosphate-sugar epimerase